MILILFTYLTRAAISFGFEMSEFWSADNQPQLSIVCEKSESFCADLCFQNTSCELDVKICRDCVGTSLIMTNIFEKMGVQYRNTGASISYYEFIDFLREKNFVFFSSKSIYNQIESYDSPLLRARFQKLCPSNIEYPIVFFGLKKKGGGIEHVRYVACGNEVYAMSAQPDIILTKNLYFYHSDQVN